MDLIYQDWESISRCIRRQWLADCPRSAYELQFEFSFSKFSQLLFLENLEQSQLFIIFLFLRIFTANFWRKKLYSMMKFCCGFSRSAKDVWEGGTQRSWDRRCHRQLTGWVLIGLFFAPLLHKRNKAREPAGSHISHRRILLRRDLYIYKYIYVYI